MSTIARIASGCFLAVVIAAPAADMAPDALVRSTVNDVQSAIQQTRDPRALVDLAEKKVIRGTFQSEIGRSGIDGLIKAIESKNQKQG